MVWLIFWKFQPKNVDNLSRLSTIPVGTNQLEIYEPFDGISWNLSVPVLSGFPQNTFHIQTDQSILNGKLPFHLVCYVSGKVLTIMHRSPQPNLLNKWKAPQVSKNHPVGVKDIPSFKKEARMYETDNPNDGFKALKMYTVNIINVVQLKRD